MMLFITEVCMSRETLVTYKNASSKFEKKLFDSMFLLNSVHNVNIFK